MPKRKIQIVTLLIVTLTATTSLAVGGPKLSIEKTIRTKTGMEFVILIENSGPSSVFLEETSEGSRDPYAINIQQLQSESNWVSIGPHRDVPATSVFELKPGAKVQKTVTVTDPYVDLRSPTRRQYPIRGQHRATTRYFLSPPDWSDFKRNLLGRIPKRVFSQITSIPDDVGISH
jgi:hypothetical protein